MCINTKYLINLYGFFNLLLISIFSLILTLNLQAQYLEKLAKKTQQKIENEAQKRYLQNHKSGKIQLGTSQFQNTIALCHGPEDL